MVCEVSALDHEVFDDAMEGRAFVSVTFLASCQSAEVFCRLLLFRIVFAMLQSS